MPASIPVLECLPACLHRNACKHSCARMPASIPAQECLQGTPAPARLHRHAPREYRERPARVPREQHPAPGGGTPGGRNDYIAMPAQQCLHSNACAGIAVQAVLSKRWPAQQCLHSHACAGIAAQATARATAAATARATTAAAAAAAAATAPTPAAAAAPAAAPAAAAAAAV